MFVYIFCFKVSTTFSNFCEIFCSTEWFQQQQKLTNEIDNTEVNEIKCLAKFYVSVRKTDGSYYKKTSLLLIRAALDQNLKAPNFFKNVFFMLFSRMIIDVIILVNLGFGIFVLPDQEVDNISQRYVVKRLTRE